MSPRIVPRPFAAPHLGGTLFKVGFVLLALAIGTVPPCTPAQAAGGYTTCVVGDRVADDAGNRGTVTYVNADGSCGFKYDNSGMTNTYPPAQLRRVGRAAAVAGFAFVPPGRYECYAGENYTFTDIIIVSRSKYRDNKGNSGWYSFDRGSQVITFKSGTFKNSYAKYTAVGRIGLASKPDTFFSELCEMKH